MGARIEMIDMVKTGENLKKLFGGESLTKAAEWLGVSVSTVSYWINGKKVPSISHLAMIARHFGVKIDDIVAVNDEA